MKDRLTENMIRAMAILAKGGGVLMGRLQFPLGTNTRQALKRRGFVAFKTFGLKATGDAKEAFRTELTFKGWVWCEENSDLIGTPKTGFKTGGAK